MTRRAPTGPKSTTDRDFSLRRTPLDAAGIDAQVEEGQAATIEEIGPLHPDHVPQAAPVFPRPAGRRVVALTAIGLLCAVGVAAGVGKAFSERAKLGLGPTSPHVAPAAAAPPAAAPEAKPILADYRPPDRDQVRKAYLNVGSVYRGEGLSGVVRQTIGCFDSLRQAPAYDMLDYCIALDAYGGALDREIDDERPAGDGYFAGAGLRDLAAAKAVVGADGDPGARVLDVKRLAGEVSEQGPAAARKAIAAVSGGAGPAPADEGAPGVGPGRRGALQLRRPVTIAQADAPKSAPPKVMLAKPSAMKLAVAKPAPVKVVAVKAAGAAPRIEKRATAKPFEHPKLEKASTPIARHPKPAIVQASAKAKPERRRSLQMAKAQPRHEQSPLIRAATRAMASFARTVKTSLHPAKPAPTVAERRAAEPAEWIDCRRPRTLSEERICEDIDSGGDGTMQGQLSRSKYEGSGRQ
jgi:hypothetical protein